MKGAAVAERLQGAEEGQFAGIECPFQILQEQPAEETSEHAHGQKEGRPAGDPTAAVAGETATGDAAKVKGLTIWLRPASVRATAV